MIFRKTIVLSIVIMILLVTFSSTQSYPKNNQLKFQNIENDHQNQNSTIKFQQSPQSSDSNIPNSTNKSPNHQQKNQSKLIIEQQIYTILLVILIIVIILVGFLLTILCILLIKKTKRKKEELKKLIQTRQNPQQNINITPNDQIKSVWIKLSYEENQEYSLGTSQQSCTICSSFQRQCNTIIDCQHYFHFNCLQHSLLEKVKCPNCKDGQQNIRKIKIILLCPSCSMYQLYFPTARNFLAFCKFEKNKICYKCQENIIRQINQNTNSTKVKIQQGDTYNTNSELFSNKNVL